MGGQLKRIYIIDENQIFIQAAIDLLSKSKELEVVGAACNHHLSLDAIRKSEPDVVLLDFEMHGVEMRDMIKSIKNLGKQTVVIVLALTDTQAYSREASRMGADGFVSKAFLGRDLIPQIYMLTQSALIID